MRGAKLVRVVFLAVIAVGIAKAIAALRGPKAEPFVRHPTIDGGPTATPDGPLLDPLAEPAPTADAANPGPGTDDGPVAELASPPEPDGVLADPRRDLAGELAAPDPTPELAAAGVVEALGTGGEQRWAEPVEGACPDGFPIKAKLRSGIYHQPGGLAYERTKPDRCYASVGDAEADGLRPPKR